MKFAFIHAQKAHFPIAFMCEQLEVSRSGYYAWASRPQSARTTNDQKLAEVIADVHEESRRRYGSPRVFRELKARGYLKQQGITCSMSRKGNCWDNAVVESFFSSLKMELVYERSFQTHEEARRALFEYIEAWYNRRRRHSALGYVSPEEYERNASTRSAAA